MRLLEFLLAVFGFLCSLALAIWVHAGPLGQKGRAIQLARREERRAEAAPDEVTNTSQKPKRRSSRELT